MGFVASFLPLNSFLLVGFRGRDLGTNGSLLVTVCSVFLSFVLSLFCLYNVFVNQTIINFVAFTWFKIGSFSVNWGFLFDPLSLIMLGLVTFISSLVHFYSIEYMAGDPHMPRFFSYLSLFTFFMLFLVTADNVLQLFVGWEGVGLCSFLLINFWFSRLQANKSAIKAIVVNRVGDFGLTVAIILIYCVFKSLEFPAIFMLAPYLSSNYFYFFGFSIHAFSLISFFLFLAAVGKSAQLGLHTWLPDAMEGPTPVSALIHAATMVTAGVFLLIRSSSILEYSPFMLSIIALFGALTSFFAASTAIFQYDLKRVIAFSTCSQLGYMFMSIGLSNYALSMFHLVNHAFFKALLFLSAGAVIHALYDEQDMRRMGQLYKLLPITFSFIVIGSLSLMGFPFLTGFFSKDAVFEFSYFSYSNLSLFCFILALLAAFCTSFYSIRLLYLTFFSSSIHTKTFEKKVHEPYWFMLVPMITLAFFSIFAGYILKDLFIGLGSLAWTSSLFVLPHNINIDAEFISLLFNFKQFPFINTCLAAWFAYLFYHSLPYRLYKFSKQNRNLYAFFIKKWSFDIIYNGLIVRPLLKVGYQGTFKVLDRGLLEFMGPSGATRFVNSLSILFSNVQSGFVFHYLILFVFGFVLPLFYVFYSFFILSFFSFTTIFYLLALTSLCLPSINSILILELENSRTQNTFLKENKKVKK